jgi:ubiquinone/menaquinone biosynthesis C-methylase UbiE
MPADWDSHWNTKGINHDIMQIWAGYFVDSYQKYFGFSKNDVVLDFGAGLGDVSFLIKDKVQRIFLFDKSKYFLEELGKRFERFENVQVADSLQEITEPVSLIIISGVIHYMNEKELKEILIGLHGLCDFKTRIIISDIVPPDYSKLIDGFSQLLTGLRKKFFIKLFSYIVTNIFHDPKLSLETSSLYKYDEETLKQTLGENGYSARRMENNFSYSKYRYTLLCRLMV